MRMYNYGRIMMKKQTVKTQMVNDEMMLPIPDGVTIADNYSVRVTANNQLIFTPQQPSVFEDPKYANTDFAQTELIKGTIGRESF